MGHIRYKCGRELWSRGVSGEGGEEVEAQTA